MKTVTVRITPELERLLQRYEELGNQVRLDNFEMTNEVSAEYCELMDRIGNAARIHLAVAYAAQHSTEQ